MSSVKSRILQFQNQSPIDTGAINSTSNSNTIITTPVTAKPNGNSNNFHHNLKSTSAPTTPPPRPPMNHIHNNGNEGTPPSKPPLNLSSPTKKTSMNINLSENHGAQTSTSTPPLPTKTGIKPPLASKLSVGGTSAIPKLVTHSHGHGHGQGSSNSNVTTNGKVYGNIDWKDKYEESEKKRTHVVALAQKATRDFEELRRRYHDVYTENEKLNIRLENSNVQLDKLRKASEATYDEYYKLKKKYEVENSAKSDALVRVDQYNKENRRLKRQSQVLMQQMGDSNFGNLDEIIETSSESPENDREIVFLRNRVQELEARIVDLESELEKTKLAEFETQESVLLMNDSIQSSKSETQKLLHKIRQLEDDKSDLKSTVEELTFELDSIKTEDSFQAEKLRETENQLLKVSTEKKVLQRQSMVFMSSATDAQLLDALNQISELQFTVEEQKLNYESQISELQDRVNEQTSQSEASKIKIDSKIRTLEEQLKEMQARAEEAEHNLSLASETNFSGANNTQAPAPPPPPMPPKMACAPPPPPLPAGGLGSGSGPGSSLGDSLKTATLRRSPAGNGHGNGDCNNSSGTTSPSNMNGATNGSPQIDDVISQLKKGIKLRPMDRALSRKQTEPLEKQGEETAVEEMRSILNNLKRTRRIL